MRVIVAAVLVAALAAGCDDNGQKYSRSDVERAFRSQGFELVPPNRPSVLDKEAMLALVDRQANEPQIAKIGQPTLVLVYEDEEDATNGLTTLGSESSAFHVRHGNVVVIADESVTAPIMKRMLAALAQLD